MKDGSIQNKWRESLWRPGLNPHEEAQARAWLAAHPEAQAEWELEAALSAALQRLPDATVPSNFTDRILQAVEREGAKGAPAGRWRWLWRVAVPRLAVGVAVLGIAGLAYQRHQFDQRAELARNVARVAESQPLPSIEALKNFEAIRRMSQSKTPADDELLSLLQ